VSEKYLTPQEAAAVLGKPVRTLEDWRCKRSAVKGPPFVKFGRDVRYPQTRLLAWVEERLQAAE